MNIILLLLITFLTQASRNLTSVMHRRIDKKIGDVLTENLNSDLEELGGTRDAVLAFRQLTERKLVVGNVAFTRILDVEKAFDHVDWVKMFQQLTQLGVNFRDRRLIWQLYKNKTAVINFSWEEMRGNYSSTR